MDHLGVVVAPEFVDEVAGMHVIAASTIFSLVVCFTEDLSGSPDSSEKLQS